MLSIPEDQKVAFRTAVEAARLRVEVRDAVGNVYLALQDAIDLRKPICETSGRCCRFDEYGHRLFVTTMEMGAFLSGLSPEECQLTAAPGGGGCPFQVRGLCGVHGIRPFGCRIFFCDTTAADWQKDQYERFHAELKRLHEALGVPYFYVEWRMALQILGTTGLAT